MKSIVFAILVLTVLCRADGLSAKEFQLSVAIEKTSDGYIYSVKNTSAKDLSVPKLFLAKPDKTGYWIFLYDISAKEIEYAWSLGSGSPEMMSRPIPGEVLRAGEVRKAKFSNEYIRSLFQGFSSGKCFYLMGKYLKGELESKTSDPIRICSE